MGLKLSTPKLCKRREVQNVDKKKSGRGSAPAFSNGVFQKYEWPTLQAFCTKHAISQKNLVVVFRMYLSHDEVFLRQFQVRVMDIKTKFLRTSKLMQELADTFIPLTFMRDFAGLEPVGNPEEISFARLTILGYMFLAQQVPDLILDFFAILRQRFTLKLVATLFQINFSGLIVLLTEDLQKSHTLQLALKALTGIESDEEVTILKAIRLAIKYPLLFYSLERFRKHFKRVLFGDQFWLERKQLKSKIKLAGYHRGDTRSAFESERHALRETARSIMADVLFSVVPANKPYLLTDKFIGRELSCVDDGDCDMLKCFFGYTLCKSLLVESEVQLLCKPHFLRDYVHIRIVGDELQKDAYVAEADLEDESTEDRDDGAIMENLPVISEKDDHFAGGEEFLPPLKSKGSKHANKVDDALSPKATRREMHSRDGVGSPGRPRRSKAGSNFSETSSALDDGSTSEKFNGRDHGNGSRTSSPSKQLGRASPSRQALLEAAENKSRVKSTSNIPHHPGRTELEMIPGVWRGVFLNVSHYNEVVYDAEADRNVLFNVATGHRVWALQLIDEEGDLFKDIYPD